jgi:DNA-binding MarR family transcriptional regulator
MPDETPMPDPEPRRLPPLLRRAWYSLNQTFRKRIAHLEITPDQFSILRWLHEGDRRGLTQQSLTDLMASDPNTITSILHRMEKAGLISRHAHESDRRARRVRIEPKGEKVFSTAIALAKALQSQILEALPVSRRQSFLRDLEKVADACVAAHFEVSPPGGHAADEVEADAT